MTGPDSTDDAASDGSGDTSEEAATAPEAETGLDDAGYDAAFADIISHWTDVGRAADAPETEDTDTATPPPAPPAATLDPAVASAAGATESSRVERIARDIDRAVDGPDGGRFVPPEPPPLPRLDLVTMGAWIAVVGGPVTLVVGALGPDLPRWVLGVGAAALIGGFAILASRLQRRDEVDPDDDGAVV